MLRTLINPNERIQNTGNNIHTNNEHIDVSIKKYRSIWISDIHLGTKGCKAHFLLNFLKKTESDNLFLVGDIFDGWQLKKNWFWNQSHNDVIQKILRKSRKGTKVIYIVGNHDEALRNFLGITFGDIKIVDEFVYTALNKKKYLIIHGDKFDSVIRNVKWLAYLGDYLYVQILKFNNIFNKIRRHLGFTYWSLSNFLKHKVKNAVNFITEYENLLAGEAKKRNLDGVICGHIHKAEIKEIDGILYCNDGDWVESLTALVETVEGKLEIIYWPFSDQDEESKKIKKEINKVS